MGTCKWERAKGERANRAFVHSVFSFNTEAAGGPRRPLRLAVLALRDLTARDFGLAIAVDCRSGGLKHRSGAAGSILSRRRSRHCVEGGGFSVALRGPRAVSVQKIPGLTPTPQNNGKTPDSNTTTVPIAQNHLH